MRFVFLSMAFIGLNLGTAVYAAGEDGVQEPAASGYGQFPWGTPIKDIAKHHKGMKPYGDAEPVRTEREAANRIYGVARAEAKAKGKKALRAFKKTLRQPLRLHATRHWLKLSGLPARVQMHFFDGELFEVKVHILYRRKERARAGEILDVLVDKYGEPKPPATKEQAEVPVSRRMAMLFQLADGNLEVLRARSTKKTRGMIRLRYLSDSLGIEVEEHLAALKDEVQAIDEAIAARRLQRPSAKTLKLKRLRENL
jgi:hypothetical protein